jgi:integrase
MSCLSKPHCRSTIIPRNSLTVLVQEREIELSLRAALVGGLSIPMGRRHPVTANSLGFGVHVPKIELRIGISLISCLSKRTYRRRRGTDIRIIQALLGHDKLDTTARYTRVATGMIARIESPLDLLSLPRKKPRKAQEKNRKDPPPT